jgi:hypothetical protein
LETNISTIERNLARSEAKNEALQLQIKDREEYSNTCKLLQLSAEDSKKLCEEKLDMYINDSDNLREKIKQGSLEITKGNSVITRLNTDKNILNNKIKMKSDVIRKQELIIKNLNINNNNKLMK